MKRWFLLLVLFFLVIGTVVDVQASVCEDTIAYNQTKSFWVAPAGSLEVCYFPNGQGTVRMGVRVAWWNYFANQDPPVVTVDVYWASSSESTNWTWISSVSTMLTWEYSPPLYLQEGVYIFSVRVTDLSLIELKIDPY